MSEHEHLLLMVFHHIATDGWSMEIINNYLSEAYRQKQVKISFSPLQYLDFSQWQLQFWQQNNIEEKIEREK